MIAPVKFRVAPVTCAPNCFVTGIDSPVSIDSSTLELPAIISPSTGIFSPAQTTMRSPTCKSSTAIGICSSPSALLTNNLALAGCNSIKARIALEALPLALSNKACPSNTNPSSITGSSKKHCQFNCGTNKAIVLAKYAETVPKPTNEFIFGARYHSDFNPSHQIGRPIQPRATVETTQWAYILPTNGRSVTPIKPKCPTIAKPTSAAGIIIS